MRRIVVLTVLVAMVAAACGEDTTGTTAGTVPLAPKSLTSVEGGFAFSYPTDWNEIPGLEVETQVGPSGTLAMVAVGNLDSSSGNLIGISVQVDELGVVVSAADERLFLESQLDSVMAEVAVQAGGTLSTPEWTTVAGHDARVYVIQSVVRGQDLTSRTTALVVGDHFYKALCQATPAGFTVTATGCDLITSTLDIG